MNTQPAKSNRIPVVHVPISKEVAHLQAEANLEKIKKVEAFEQSAKEFLYALQLDIPPRAKLNRLLEASEKVSSSVKPYTACKSECSFCCNISAIITATEAEVLGKASGRKPRKLTGRVDMAESQEKWYKVPCPFLKAGRCSVYSARPIVCRLMLNLADSAHFCDTAIPSKQSYVTMINMNQLLEGYSLMYAFDTWADIRDFFPPKR